MPSTLQADDQSQPQRAAEALAGLDTTGGSVLHAVLGQRPAALPSSRVSNVRLYVITVCLTYVPLGLMAFVTLPTLTARSPALSLPFLYDLNVAFMFTVSLPLLVIYSMSDQRILTSAIVQIVREDLLVLDLDTATRLRERWEPRFARLNGAAQVVAALVAIVVAWTNAIVVADPSLGHWAGNGGRLSPAGYLYLWCLFLFYFVTTIYAARCLATILFLRELVGQAEIKLVPFHPDRCGGLRPVGEIGLRNQYALSVIGINLALLFFVSFNFLPPQRGLLALVAVATAAYVVLGPVVFLGPLLPFREGMFRAKTDLMKEVAGRLRVELANVRRQLPNGPITRDDEELIERLQKIASFVEKLPVWPFDADTVRKFATAFLLPVVGSWLSAQIPALLKLLRLPGTP
jgi:hypothetical protein